jgi:mRNA-degrading endonuclease RelE of RelBE toxin-antitoxin system
LSYRVSIAPQVLRFLEQLPPVPRRAVRSALEDLRGERGDIRSLEDPLAGFCRARAGKYRIIFRYAGNLTIHVLFVGERKLVYEVFAEEFARSMQARSPR